MIKHLPRTLKIALAAVGGLVLAWLLFAWLALPPLLQSQATRFIADKTGHRLRLDAPEFNPFELRLRLRNLALEEPGGAPLLSFRELEVDLSAASITRRALVFDGIRLERPAATVVVHAGDKLNWSAFVDALKSKEDKPDDSLPRLEIRSFVLVGGQIEVADQRGAGGFARRIEPIDLELKDVSTLPNEKGSIRLAARTGVGERLQWEGRIVLNPLALSGNISVADVELSRLAPLLGDALPIAPPQGKVELAADYRVTESTSGVDLALDRINAKVTGLRLQRDAEGGSAITVETIEARDGHFGLAQSSATLGSVTLSTIALDYSGKAEQSVKLGNLALSDFRLDLAGRSATLAHAALSDGRIGATRDASGRLDLVEGLKKFLQWRAKPAASAAEGEGGGPPWRYRIDKAELAGFTATFRDESLTPAAEIAIVDIGASIEGISEDLQAPRPITASFKARDGGRFEAGGTVAPVPFVADIQVKLSDLALMLAQPYVTATTTVDLRGGSFSTAGRATYDARGPAYRGGFALRDLRVNEGGSDRVFLAWKSLRTGSLQATPARLDINELVLDGLDTNIVIEQDKSVNVTKIMKKPAAAAEGRAAPAPAGGSKLPEPPPVAAAPDERKARDFLINIDRLRIANGEMDFADHSLLLPFGTRIVKLNGAINGLSSRPDALGQVEVDGQVDDYGLARIFGQVNLFNPADFTDLKVVFRNVEMTRLTPYTATFAGRKIDSGKLSLDLEYKIVKRQLLGDNKIVMDRLVLGERVESPGAKNLPLDLAIAILQDSDGRIDLGLPVAGSLDDPQFSYGQIVWKAIVNVLTRIVTAPFRALGALFGGGEQFDSIVFEAGSPRLTPPEQEKLVRLAGALNKRPGLVLAVNGTYSPADRLALQDLQLRRSVALRAGQSVEGQTDPGPLSARQPKVQAALESLFSERFGGGELAALKDGYRRANPGQLEESATGKMVSQLASLVREQRTLGEGEVEKLKGVDFHAELFLRLREREVVGDDRLVDLGKQRGEFVVSSLRSAGGPAERVELGAPERLEGDPTAKDIPVKIIPATARKGSS